MTWAGKRLPLSFGSCLEAGPYFIDSHKIATFPQFSELFSWTCSTFEFSFLSIASLPWQQQFSFITLTRTVERSLVCNISTTVSYCIFIDRVSLTALTYSKRFIAIHVRVAYMKICLAEDPSIPPWGIMNASMTLQSLNYLTITLYRLGETESSRYGNKSFPNHRDIPESFHVISQSNGNKTSSEWQEYTTRKPKMFSHPWTSCIE